MDPHSCSPWQPGSQRLPCCHSRPRAVIAVTAAASHATARGVTAATPQQRHHTPHTDMYTRCSVDHRRRHCNSNIRSQVQAPGCFRNHVPVCVVPVVPVVVVVVPVTPLLSLWPPRGLRDFFVVSGMGPFQPGLQMSRKTKRSGFH